MTPTLRRTAALVGLALGLALAPAAARAQHTKTGGQTPAESLTAQEKEMLALGNEFARRVTEVLERWISAREISPDRLFSFFYYPVPDTDPPKFTTDYDRLSDRDLLAIQESVLARSPTIVYTVTVDRNGYLPTHNTRYSQPLSGNRASDLVNNRTKRIFNDRTGLAAAQSVAPWLIQRYLRDTGETMADLSVPVNVQGRHWGAIRIGFRYLER